VKTPTVKRPRPGEALDCQGRAVKAKHGLCRYCDLPLRKGSVDYGDGTGAHQKCDEAQRNS